MNHQEIIRIQFHGRAFDTQIKNDKFKDEDYELISIFNQESDIIADEIIQELKSSLPIGLGISGDIEFHRGSVGWQGVLEILTWTASIGGTIGFVDYLSKLVQAAVNRIMRRHIRKHTAYFRNFETFVVVNILSHTKPERQKQSRIVPYLVSINLMLTLASLVILILHVKNS